MSSESRCARCWLDPPGACAVLQQHRTPLDRPGTDDPNAGGGLVGYVFAIRSERQICAEVQVNLAYRWFCRLSIEDKIPDHSVFSRARHERFRESAARRRGCEA